MFLLFYCVYVCTLCNFVSYLCILSIFISPYSVAFGVILSLLFVFFVFFCTVEDISTQDGAIGVKF